MKIRILIWPIAFIFTGCGSKEPQVRKYLEYVEAKKEPAPMQAGLPAGHPALSGHFPGDGHVHGEQALDVDAASVNDMMDPSAPQVSFESPTLVWDTPENWMLEPGGNAMRLATFKVSKLGIEATTTIVALGGAAGGLESNISRWLGQLGVSADAEKLSSFINGLPEIVTVSGDKGHVVDLSSWVSADAASMLAGIISRGDQTIFVKMTGPTALLAEEKSAFNLLCESIR